MSIGPFAAPAAAPDPRLDELALALAAECGGGSRVRRSALRRGR